MFIYLNKKGQSTLEYSVIVAVVVAGLIAMQVYIKRGMQGRLRQASDDIGEQFSPGYTTSNYTTTSNVTSNESTVGSAQGEETTVRSESTSAQTQSKTGNEAVAALAQEDWGKK
jgi:uncharacterized protein (UPF0333 family)